VGTRFRMCHGGWEVWLHGVSAIIQCGPKVGIQFIVNYCVPTVYQLLAHPVFITELIIVNCY